MNDDKPEEDTKHKTSCIGHVEPVVSAENMTCCGDVSFIAFDGVFLRKAKSKVGAKRTRSQKVRVVRTESFTH